MWNDIEDRILENENENPVALRKDLLDAIKASGLEPGPVATKYMVSFWMSDGEVLGWEIRGSARNFFVSRRFQDTLESAGLAPTLRTASSRISALNSHGLFGSTDCASIQIEDGVSLTRLIELVHNEGPTLHLKPEAISRWVDRLQIFFPELKTFQTPSERFDRLERDYKLKTAHFLRNAVERAMSDEELAEAIHSALAGSNLLQWRTYWPLSPKGDANRTLLWPALSELIRAARADSREHPEALEKFAVAWMEAVPNAKRDPARQIGEFLFLHLNPGEGSYIRYSVRQDFWLEAIGTRFVESPSLATTYVDERRFMRAVRSEFKRRGLAPRDMIDVQSVLWVVHNYGDAEMNGSPETTIPPKVKNMPENIIFYGPPGTGKTYRTAREAVRICLRLEDSDPLLSQNTRRADLMDRYRALVSEGRIEFTTFHQSLSYEEFVEGLRPSTSNSQEITGEVPPTGGFHLTPHEGIFKRISERARLDTGEMNGQRLDRSRSVFKVSLGRRGAQEDRVRDALDHSLIHLGWGGDIDWSDPLYDEFEEILKTWKVKEPETNGRNGNVEQTWSFRSAMQIGDYVAIADGRDRIRALGRVSGDYYYDAAATYHSHRRNVDWIWKDATGAARELFYARPFRQQSVYELNRDVIDWDGLERIAYREDRTRPVEDARDFVLIIDEINRANISKVFGELITLLEVDKRLGMENEIRLRLPYSGSSFGVPANLHIIGTMNTADRSIALLDTALRRRFTFRELMPDLQVLSENVGGINLRKLLGTINERIEYLFDREHQIGHAYFTQCRIQDDVDAVMRHKIIPLLVEYFYEDWSKVAAVLGERPSGTSTRFLEAVKLRAPSELSDSDLAGDRVRWVVKSDFDFTEFMAE